VSGITEGFQLLPSKYKGTVLYFLSIPIATNSFSLIGLAGDIADYTFNVSINELINGDVLEFFMINHLLLIYLNGC